MNEYTVVFLNGIKADIMAENWKDSIKESKSYAIKGGFSDNIKLIMDEDNNVIRSIDINSLTFKHKL